MRKFITMLAAILTLSFAGFAQINEGRITGTVKDGDARTIEAATITLKKTADSSIAKVSVASKEGLFVFENIADGSYFVAISAVGHEPSYSPVFELTAANRSIVLQTIELVPQAKTLGAVVVTSKRPLIEQKIDRMVVNVEASITNVGSSALEVLEKSPGITVDKDGNISLKGKQGVIVLVDGRQTYLSGPDLANMLRSMTSAQLDQIEIMTNPPAKFDAAGNSGVINIKTKKSKQFGYSGSVTLGYGQGRYPKLNEAFNFNYRTGKLNLFTNISHNYWLSFQTLTIQRSFRDAGTKELTSSFDQVANMRNEGHSYNGKLGMDYFASKNTTIGVVFTGFSNPRSMKNRNLSDLLGTDGTLLSRTKASSIFEETWKNYSANLNVRHVLDTTGREITGDLDYLRYSGTNDMTLINSFFNSAGNTIRPTDTLLGALPQDISIYSGKVDYLHPLKKGAKFEAGIKSSYVKTDNNARYDSLLNGQLVHDENRSNYFIYEENINAAYVNLSHPLSKKLTAQVGLRLENTTAKGNQVKTGEMFDRNYTQLFPTAFLQYTVNESNTIGMNYGRRIQRPNYKNLNPFIEFLDRYTYQQGNPNLKPQFSHNIELSHTFKGFLTTTLNYTRTTDIIQQVMEQIEEDTLTFVKQANIAKQRQVGIAISASKEVTKWWSGNIYVNVYQNHFDGLVNNELVSVGGTTMVLNASQQFKFNKGWGAEISGFYRTESIEGVFRIMPLGMMNAGVSKQILKGKGSLRVTVRDVLYSQKFRGASKYGAIDAAFQNKRDSRVVNLGFTYRFSKGKVNGNGQKKRGSAADEQSRVGGGGGN